MERREARARELDEEREERETYNRNRARRAAQAEQAAREAQETLEARANNNQAATEHDNAPPSPLSPTYSPDSNAPTPPSDDDGGANREFSPPSPNYGTDPVGVFDRVTG